MNIGRCFYIWPAMKTLFWHCSTNCYLHHVLFYSSFSFVATMIEKLVYLTFRVALLQGITTALQPSTENNYVLVGHVFQQFYATDWFNCIQACHDEPTCISYNYQRSAGANGLCELNDCGVEDLCDRDKLLIYSPGFVFQQIREGKVRFLPFVYTRRNKSNKTNSNWI